MGFEGRSLKWSKYEKFVSEFGKWAWIIGILSGIIDFIWGLYGIIVLSSLPFGWGISAMGTPIWLVLSGIFAIIVSYLIIKPKFSEKCANQDWGFLLNWIILLGNFRFPWMLFWGIIMCIFGYGWGGIPILIPSILLLFAGPIKFEWSTKG